MSESARSYNDFRWRHEGAGNGASGEGLTRTFLALVKNLNGVSTICDLGCGNGYMTGRLAALGYNVVGIDASETGLFIARQTYPEVQFHRCVIGGLSNNDFGKFDLVISSDVIEHLYRPSDLLSDAHCLLKAGGQILIGTPYHGYLKNVALSLTGKMDSHFTVLDDAGHVKFFSVRTLSSLLQRNGFCDLRFTFYGRAPWLWKNMICHARKSG